MKTCPCCGKEMTPGYLESWKMVFWTPKKRILPLFRSQSVIALTGDGETDGKAWLCRACGQIIVPLPQQEMKKE